MSLGYDGGIWARVAGLDARRQGARLHCDCGGHAAGSAGSDEGKQHMAIIRKWADIEAKGDGWLTPAEERLLEACATGDPCVFGNWQLPPEGLPNASRLIRAEILKYILLGGCERQPFRDGSLRLAGAWIEGDLDLSYLSIPGALYLHSCRFLGDFAISGARVGMLSLASSVLNDWNATGLECRGEILLPDVTVNGLLGLMGARILGQLRMSGIRATSPYEVAINLRGAEVGGATNLSHAKILGCVDFSSARLQSSLTMADIRIERRGLVAVEAEFLELKGDMNLRSANLDGRLDLPGANIGGCLHLNDAEIRDPGGHALNMRGLKVARDVELDGLRLDGTLVAGNMLTGGSLSLCNASLSGNGSVVLDASDMTVSALFVWQDVKVEPGALIFAGAQIGTLADDVEEWPDIGPYFLHLMTYRRLGLDTDLASRLNWVARGSYFEDAFHPQPHTQLADIYLAMGRDTDAAQVRRQCARLERKDHRRRLKLQPDGSVSGGLLSLWKDVVFPLYWLWDVMLRAVVGYGYAPGRALIWLVFFWAIASGLAQMAWQTDAFVPNQVSSASQADFDDQTSIAAWRNGGGRDWERFNAIIYGADLVIPVVELGQVSAWSPSAERGPWGERLWRYKALLIAAGWLVSALGAAAITGIIRRE